MESSSGITADEEVQTTYNRFKLQNSKSEGEKYSYIIMRIVGEKIKVTKKAPPGASWSEFVSEGLKEDKADGCYGLYDMKVEDDEGKQIAKILLVAWAPDTLNVKRKMVYASALNPLKSALGDGIAYFIQASDESDVDEEDIVKMVKKGR